MRDSGTIHPVHRLVQLLTQVVVRHVLAMSKTKWSSGIEIRTLSGEEWLRLLTGETNMVVLIGWCGHCRVGECYQETCSRCGEALILFGEPFWAQVGRKIRRTLQKNRTVLSRIKSDRESLYGTQHQPTFPAPLDWLRILWAKTSLPPHQPFASHVHYQVANRVGCLRRLGLSKGEIIEVLGHNYLPAGRDTGTRQEYAKLPLADLITLRKEFRQAIVSLPGSVKDLSEMGRTIRWVDRQRTAPMARLRGERVRERNSSED